MRLNKFSSRSSQNSALAQLVGIWDSMGGAMCLCPRIAVIETIFPNRSFGPSELSKVQTGGSGE